MSTPLYDMLKNYAEKQPFPFHMPGHLLGRGLSDALAFAGKLDITEIPGSDNLHAPEGVILEAQQLSAALFGAARTLFLVNGSTIGVHAMINAVVKPGGKILIGRDCHRSVLNALTLLGAEPVFVMPQYDMARKLPLGYSTDDVKKILEKHPDVSAILLTCPNYYGIATDLTRIAQIAHAKGIPLLVDEAHGAHFCLHDRLPLTALEMGADLCVQSLHKTLPALTQTALLHVGHHSLIPGEAIAQHVSMLQTTSPSYVLMASIDLMRETMEKSGRIRYTKLYERIHNLTCEINGLDGMDLVSVPSCFHKDFTRLVLSFETVSGFEAEQFLRTQRNIVVEMADIHHIVLITTPFHTEQDFDVLIAALRDLSSMTKPISKAAIVNREPPMIVPDRAIGLREAVFSSHKDMLFCESSGCICSEAIVPYPPGIPLVYPGEVISQPVIDYVDDILNAGGTVYGIMDKRIKVIRNE